MVAIGDIEHPVNALSVGEDGSYLAAGEGYVYSSVGQGAMRGIGDPSRDSGAITIKSAGSLIPSFL